MTYHEGVWFLSFVRDLRNAGEWPVYVPTSLTGIYGWIAGGQYLPVNSFESAIQRYVYNTDTTNAAFRTTLTLTRAFIAPVSNGLFSWYGGGYNNSQTNLIDRLDHTNDTTTALDRCDRTIASFGASGLSNGTNGWFAGGNGTSGGTGVNVIDRITYATDTANAIDRADLDSVSGYARHVGLSNGTFGYVGGGDQFSPFPNLTVDRITYASDTSNAVQRNTLTTQRAQLAAVANGTNGWFAGGSNSPGVLNVIDRIVFSNDTTSMSDRADLSVARAGLTGMTNGTYGWFAGGKDTNSQVLPGPGTILYGTIDRLDYANDTANAISRASSSAIADSCSTQNSSAAY